MAIRFQQAFIPHLEPEASLAFYRDGLGMEVREDVGSGPVRWITLGAPGRHGGEVLLGPPASAPGVTCQERQLIRELMSKGVYAQIWLSTSNLAAVFERLEACPVGEVIQEPMERPFGGRACSFLDPAGTLVRIVEED
jgi:catechol 2,3-dioxygenase-like lactoylglutathione lyase family enzyme